MLALPRVAVIDSQTLPDLARESASAVGFDEGYEADQLAYVGDALRGVSRFIDIGAHMGVYAYMANRILRNATITLIDANPDIVTDLRKAVTSWPHDRGNHLEVLGVAVGDTSEALPFFLGTEDVHGTLTQKNEGRPVRRVEVMSEPLDSLLPARNDTLIKVDVEGSEYRVLNGAEELLSKHGVRVVVELHGWGDAERKKYPYHVLSLMRHRGFGVKRIQASYSYDFAKAGVGARCLSWFRYGAPLGIKYLLRRSGLRPLINRSLGRR